MGAVIQILLTCMPFPFGVLVLLFVAVELVLMVIHIVGLIKSAIPFL